MACIYTINNKTYSEEEFKKYVLNNYEYMTELQDVTLYEDADGKLSITESERSVPLNRPTVGKDRKTSSSTVVREKIQPAGVFISGSFIAKYIPDYASKTPEQLFGTFDENGNQIKQGMIDQKILTSLIGYRIPNQGAASNDALQIVGILPEENGDTIVAYTGVTTKTGSD